MDALEFVLALIAMFMIFFFLMARTVRRRDRRYPQEDAELIQELHHGLQRMDQRIESLETLLMDRPSARAPRAEHARAANDRE